MTITGIERILRDWEQHDSAFVNLRGLAEQLYQTQEDEKYRAQVEIRDMGGQNE